MSKTKSYYNPYTDPRLTPVQIYDNLCRGKLKKFANGFVTPETMKEIIREVFLKRDVHTREEICKKFSYKYLSTYNLGGSKRAFDYKIYNLVAYCFPEMDIKPWELTKVETGFWENEENRKTFMLWVAEKEGIDLSNPKDLRKFDAVMIMRYGGNRALKLKSTFQLISLVAKTDVKEWQVIKTPMWTEEKVISAVHWLIEEKLKWSHEEVVNKLSARIFYENDLGGMLSKYCNNSPRRALEIAYPGQYTTLRNSKPYWFGKK